tara:strand:+ start:70 stop:579 length:510 start_codon:yes stop_codon:yes gene_type:complete
MQKWSVSKKFNEVSICDHDAHYDLRGNLWTIWEESLEPKRIKFNHDKVSVSKKDVLRGIHGDFKSHKYITVLYGEIFFAIVDCRNLENNNNSIESETFILSGDKPRSILLPPGFGNAFFVLSDKVVFHYKWSYKGSYPDVRDQFTIKWNDPRLNITWPHSNPILQERDK